MDGENQRSLLPQPSQYSRLPSPKKLNELSASASNARTSHILPPNSAFASQNSAAGVKRKTLQERGGEPIRQAPVPPGSRIPNGNATSSSSSSSYSCAASSGGTSIVDASRNVSSRASTRSGSSTTSSSRTFSSSSMASSVGPGHHRAGGGQHAYNHRSTSSMSVHGQFGRSAAASHHRAASSIDNHYAYVRHGGAGHKVGPPQQQDAGINNFDVEARIGNVEAMYKTLQDSVIAAPIDHLKETIAVQRSRISELEEAKNQLSVENACQLKEVEALKRELSSLRMSADELKKRHDLELSGAERALEDAKRAHKMDMSDAKREFSVELDKISRDAEAEIRKLEREHTDEMGVLTKRLEESLQEEKGKREKELQERSGQEALARQKNEMELELKNQKIGSLADDIERVKADLTREREAVRDLKSKLSESATAAIGTESSMRSLRAQVEFLESDSKSQSQAFRDLERRTQEAVRESEEALAKLRAEETLRRKLHNQVQELKGNIRVFCRVRPTLPAEESESANVSFPDADGEAREVEVMGPEEKSSLGTITRKKNAFAFDRAFGPAARNADVFDEISQLVQSALDGYNVCIFCYGQTGSGKTHTMSSTDGMIPRAVTQIYSSAKALEEKGWTYAMEGSFIEVYNENINDLLGRFEEFDRKKHEIRHDAGRGRTTVTDTVSVALDSPDAVHSVLERAARNRSVAATAANERSSRSHSVFMLRLAGTNSTTGETCDATLNLVDLAGSERLAHSGATGDRLKETQSINRSLSCLGDVIAALGQGKEGGHVPYRNSKLTYLLQHSLGGNSKTLMFVMASPLAAHLGETLTSLRFATKVHNTHIGTAKKQSR